MNILNIPEQHIKEVTEFLVENQLILHPQISPKGIPDFSNYYGRDFIMILDRNIVTKLIELCTKGTLNDDFLLKVIGSIMFWVELNGVRITAGIALNEYAHNLNSNLNASKENDVFLSILDFYSPMQWLNLALGNERGIPPIRVSDIKSYIFNIENDHYKMHYAEMLRLTYLFANKELDQTKKMIEFIKWNNDNILFCQYTLVYACLLFSKKIKQLSISEFDQVIKKCRNQAWDLTYLSFWSTLYWTDSNSNEVFLFGTMDKDLRKIFITTHDANINPFIFCFGEKKGSEIDKEYRRIIAGRIKPDITEIVLQNLIETEEENLKQNF
ncbi:hypothetical protein [Paenibacillus xylanexedens]|uniref:hypothetical protein n=1 Tax=Paenibacillus xylanexedens TaxID=528191 RepID=UPI0011A48DA3|nr:hypothetical protein [Paenibacillus xylanexedens]